MEPEIAMLGAGCFWGVEEAFRRTPGVVATAVGYAGGRTENPTYEDVCTDCTGYAEVVRVEFDPEQISYDKLLDVFWSSHDPMTRNRQGPDVGSQYRSAIFINSPEQETAAKASKDGVQKKSPRPIVTEIVPATNFYFAENYHQQYLAKRGRGNVIFEARRCALLVSIRQAPLVAVFDDVANFRMKKLFDAPETCAERAFRLDLPPVNPPARFHPKQKAIQRNQSADEAQD